MLNDFGYIDKAIANIKEVAEKQEANIKAAAKLMADAIADDKLINVYAGGGHQGIVYTRTDAYFYAAIF